MSASSSECRAALSRTPRNIGMRELTDRRRCPAGLEDAGDPGVGRPANGAEQGGRLRERFRHFAGRAAGAAGSPWAFLGAVFTVLAWALLGPRYRFSDTWQLVINTGTTIVTFLMVFLIQNTQNRDARAIQLKLDELIRASAQTRNRLIDLEECDEEELRQLEAQFRELRARSASEGSSRAEQSLQDRSAEA
jgi:low affinity Fe/Cu permease